MSTNPPSLTEAECEVVAFVRANPAVKFSYTTSDGHKFLYDAARALVAKGLAQVVQEGGPAMVTRLYHVEDAIIQKRVQIVGFVSIRLLDQAHASPPASRIPASTTTDTSGEHMFFSLPCLRSENQ